MSNRSIAVPTEKKNQVVLNYQTVRNITSPDEQETGVKSFILNLPAFEILKLDTKENLRGYLAEYNPRKRNSVHESIRQTIDGAPNRFITRNSGFVIVASEVEVDDSKKTITLSDPSIINGAQSQGEIRGFFNSLYPVEIGQKENVTEVPFYVRAEIIVDPDQDEIVETAIARNTATPVKSISQAGARGHLLDLEKSIEAIFPDIRIRKSETDENVYDTRKILQYARLLMPTEVSGNPSASEKLRAYKNPEQCLTDFSDWFEGQKKDPSKKAKYDFTVQIAPFAIKEYEYWEKNEAWNGIRIWEETKKTGKIISVAPGLVYPIMGAISEFVKRDKLGKWIIDKPNLFQPEEMIKRANAQFRAHNSDPMYMGRSEAAYDAVRIYTQTLVQVIESMEKNK